MSYDDFLSRKIKTLAPAGFSVDPSVSALFPFQRDIVRWALRRGRAAIFADCGLGKATPLSPPGLLAPTEDVTFTGEELVVDGRRIDRGLGAGSGPVPEGEEGEPSLHLHDPVG